MNFAVFIIIFFLPLASFARPLAVPDVTDVQRAALDYARIRPDDLTNLKKRTRAAALLPSFQVGVQQNFQNNIDIAINENVSVTSNGTVIGPETSDINQRTNNNSSFEVKAVWQLSELIYNKDMLDVAQEARMQARDRRQILADVNKFYYEWLELKNGVKRPRDKRLPPPSPYRLQQVAAELDSLTGGWFSRQIR
jgi:hypothetical protein